MCWDPSGELLASVSEDSVRVWTVGNGSEADCVHELSCNGSKFHSCVFHPTYPSLLVIGCYQASLHSLFPFDIGELCSVCHFFPLYYYAIKRGFLKKRGYVYVSLKLCPMLFL